MSELQFHFEVNGSIELSDGDNESRLYFKL